MGELAEVGSMGDDDGWIFIRGLRGNAELQSVLREDSIAGSSTALANTPRTSSRLPSWRSACLDDAVRALATVSIGQCSRVIRAVAYASTRSWHWHWHWHCDWSNVRQRRRTKRWVSPFVAIARAVS